METLRRHFGSSIIVACVLVLCIGATTTLAGQRRRTPRKAATPAPTKPKTQTPQTREPEVQLERLPPDPSVEAADIAITANVRARSLIFETVPNPKVEFPGKPTSDTVWEAQRENLPTPVEPGVTYRNIGIRLKITSVFRDIDRIVAEALGEIPVSDNTKPSEMNSPQSTPKTEPPRPQSNSSQPPRRERR